MTSYVPTVLRTLSNNLEGRTPVEAQRQEELRRVAGYKPVESRRTASDRVRTLRSQGPLPGGRADLQSNPRIAVPHDRTINCCNDC